MSLYNGIDPTGYVSCGFYSETYNATGANLNSLYVSLGMLEVAPDISFNIIPLVIHLLRRVLV